MQKKGTFGSLSYLRITATCCIIFLHVCSTLVENPDLFPLSEQEWTFFCSGWRMMGWAVPVFLMITGALLLNKDKVISIHDCLFRYAARVLLALLVFGIPFGMMIEVSSSGKLSFSTVYLSVIRVITNQSFSHLWYLYMLLGIYLLLPVLKIVINYASEMMLRYILIILFVFNFIIPFLSNAAGIDIAFSLPLKGGYLFYLVMGYYIHWCKPKWSAKLPLMIAVAVLYPLIVVAAALFKPESTGYIAATNSPFTAGAALGLFSIFQRLKKPVNSKVWAKDRLAFGVYLVHPVFIHLLYRVAGVIPTGALLVPKTAGIFLLVTIASFLTSLGLSKIPLLGKYVLHS